jgi:galectin-8/galectin-9
MIQISGQVPQNGENFAINLQNGQQTSPNEIALHFNVRFRDLVSGQSIVVRTNRAYGNWGAEERDGPNPFQRGAHFDLLILIEQNEFKIAVNGQHYTSFRFRNPLAEANHVGITGDVQIHSVRTF